MCYLKCHKSINAEIAYSIHHLHYNSLLYCCLPVSVDFRSDRSMLLFIANFLLLSWMKLSGIFLPSLNYSFFFYNRGFVFRFYTCCRWACILYYYLSFHLLVCDTSSISTRFSLRHCSCLSVYKLVVQCPIVCAISWQCSLLFFIIMSGTSSLIYYFFPSELAWRPWKESFTYCVIHRIFIHISSLYQLLRLPVQLVQSRVIQESVVMQFRCLKLPKFTLLLTP